MSELNGNNHNFPEFSAFVEELEREAENPGDIDVVALARINKSSSDVHRINTEKAENEQLEIEDLRRSVVENAQYLPRNVAEQFNAIILNAPYGSYKYRIGLLKQLTLDEKRRLSRLLNTYSVSAIKFVVLDAMQFDVLMREAYEVRNLTKVETRKNQQQTRTTRVWGGNKKEKPADNFQKEVKKDASIEDFAGQRLDISNLDGYYEMLQKLESGEQNEEEIDTFSYVQFLLQDFILSGGSDLHLHSGRTGGRIRYRSQGIPYTRFSGIPLNRFQRIVNSLCSLAAKDPVRMRRDVVESVIKLRILLEGEVKDVEFRFESMPSLHCASVNLRGQTKPLRDIRKVGFAPEQLAHIAQATAKDRGIVVVTGPTGSGKTNTLNAIFAQLEEADDKVILELGSPIEIESEKRVQITMPDAPTEKMADIVYQKMFKACMRFDPDVIAFTEIRSSDEARIAFRAANTGHLVFTTLHAADVEETFGAVLGWNIDRSIIAKGILAIVAQTLIRKLCEACKIHDEEASAMAQSDIFRENEAGCPECDNGFNGRTVVAEVLYFTDEVRQWIIEGCKPSEIVSKAVESGYMMPMKQVALGKLNDGITSESEVIQLVELKTEINAEVENVLIIEEEEAFGLPIQEAEYVDM